MQADEVAVRILTLALVLAFALYAYVARPVVASDATAAPGLASPSGQQAVDDNDDTRVEVQLVVLGIAIGAVFVLGTGAYILRKKLGLVPPPPEEDPGGHD